MDAFLGALKSKTMWVALATLLLANFADPVQQFVAAHPGWAGTIVSVAFAGLRALTNSSLASKVTSPTT